MQKQLKYFIHICFFIFIFSFITPAPVKDDTVQASVTLSGDNAPVMTISPYSDIKKVALTFDDGPHSATTPALLEGLRKRNVRATFFVVGKKAEENRNIIEQMHKDGHLIGNHTNTHCNLAVMSCNSALSEIDLANSVIFDVTGSYPDYLRPPFGECGDTLDDSLNMFTVMWDIDPRDWSVQNTESVVNYVISNVQDGDIILLHDIFDTSVEAALQIVDILSAQGYEFVTVEEILFP